MENVTLLAAKLTRKMSTEGIIEYMFIKDTPFGSLEATLSIDRSYFDNVGSARADGEAFMELTRQVNDEENNRLLEGAANANFGCAEVA